MGTLSKYGALATLAAFPLAALAAGPSAGAAAAVPSAPPAGVRLVAVQYRPACDAHPGGGGGRCGGDAAQLDGEWIELVNTGGTVAMAGWTIGEGHYGHTYRFGNFAFTHGALVRVHVGSGRNGVHDLYWGMRRGALSAQGDTITLRSASGAVVQHLRYAGGGTIAWMPGYRPSGAGPWGPGTGVHCPGWTEPFPGSGGMVPYGPMGMMPYGPMGGFGGPTSEPPTTAPTSSSGSPGGGTSAPATVVHVSIENVKTPGGSEPAFVGPGGKAGAPPLFSVKAHAEVEVEVDNHDSGPHSFTSPALGLDVAIGPGATATFRFRASGPGAYQWYCDVPCGPWVMSHAGYMKGDVRVVS